MYLHGHGVRSREVVVVAVLDGERDRVRECWQRRYRCKLCGCVAVVLPAGVMPRYLYSVAAIVASFFLVAAPPVGEGLDDADAYERQGMLARPASPAKQPIRWRSLDRWVRRGRDWWPGWTSGDMPSLLVGFVVISGGRGREAALEAAVSTHARWGCAM